MVPHVLPTTVVGSYPQPDWLVNRELLSKVVPRTRMKELWRVDEAYLEQAQDDATVLAIRDMESAGIDIITDGEIRRESYSNRFATALDGVDIDKPGQVTARGGRVTEVPRIVGKIKRTRPVELRDMEFLRRNTKHAAKMTLPGPFTMSQQAKNEFYKDHEDLVMDFAAAVNEEAHDLVRAGADIIQLDEPWVRNDPDAAQALRRERDQSRAARHQGADDRPPLLRLRGGGAGRDQADGLFVPGRAGSMRCRADFHRGRAAEARSRGAQGPCGQEDPAGCA